MRLRMPSTSLMMRETSAPVLLRVVIGDRQAADVRLNRLRMSAIMRCADLESSWVSVNEVSPCTRVAPTTARISQPRSSICRLPMMLSTRNLVEAGSTSPQTRLIAMRPKPSSSTVLRGWRRAQTSGRAFQVSAADFLGLPGSAVEPPPAERGAALSEWPIRVGLPGSLGTMFFRCRRCKLRL